MTKSTFLSFFLILIVTSSILVANTSLGASNQIRIGSSVEIVSQSSQPPLTNQTGLHRYNVSTDGAGNYFMKNGTTGQIDFQSTNASAMFDNVIGNLTSGGKISVNDGLYKITSAIVDGNNNNVEIDLSSRAKLTLMSGANANIFALTNVYGWYIHEGELDGNQAGQSSGYDFAVSLINVHNSTFENMYIHDSYNAAGISVSTGSEDNYIRGCRITNNGGDGIRVWDSNKTTISSSTLEGNTLDGAQIRNSSYSMIEGNIARLNLDAGFSLCDNSYYNTVEGNSLYHNSLLDIEATNQPGIEAQHNNIEGNTINSIATAYGIKFSTSSNNTAESNQITGAMIGIYVTNSNSSDVKNNRAWGNARDGIKIEKSSDCNVSGNTAFDNSQAVGYGDGITLYDGGTSAATINNLIENNTCFDDQASKTQDYGIQETGAGCFNNTIQANDVRNNKNGAIGTVGNSTVQGNAGYNPKGYIASPLYVASENANSTIVDSGNNATWISARTYTNWGSPKTLNITGGTVTVIAVNGQTLFTTTTTITIFLQPCDTFSVTFSAAPTITVFGQ